MKRYLSVALGILTAIGGFVDIGDLVTNAEVGARFGTSLIWSTALGVLGICLFAEMSGRIAAVSGRAVFDLIRERLGPRIGLLNLVASTAITLLTFIAEIGGVALSIELAASVNYLFVIPLVALLVWLLLLKAKFSVIENGLGLLGLALVVFGVALWQLHPDWAGLGHQAVTLDKPEGEQWMPWAYYAVALLGAAMTPYEVFFFSSGGVEEKWSAKDLGVMRANVLIGFPLGGLLSVAIAATTWLVLPGMQIDSLDQVSQPVEHALGSLGLAVVIVGFVAATFGAACETGLSVGYSIGQYVGAQWGKYVKPREAALFHWVILGSTLLAVAVLMTAVDPIMVTEISVIFSAIALPLTYFPILVVANDKDYVGEHVNKPWVNVLGTFFLVVTVVVAVAAIPLMILTRMGS
ncbi:NRAMP family divalent metal transporter [Nocardioides sp. Kera G14]|uniref:NRAMP family divalent metal transporter n=1 Tax=Nocardioides sp. Kera G14 TaxID=2884264 RepID=UPI001D122162|nr:divalent metal cation transporter [Nocardioides sp. Kera G14]UDY24938.1 divalent metal cation transporter [Nocardioides sp. Kera G14]